MGAFPDNTISSPYLWAYYEYMYVIATFIALSENHNYTEKHGEQLYKRQSIMNF